MPDYTEVAAYTTLLMIDNFLLLYPNAEHGPAHIVLSDYNLNDAHIKGCIRDINGAIITEKWLGQEQSVEELVATREFLKTLLRLPEEDR